MAVGLQAPQSLSGIDGVRSGCAAAGVRKDGTDDLTLFELAPGSHVAAVFTRNAFCAAPVVVAREHLVAASPRYLLVNAGNANAGTGVQGMADARACCEAVAAMTGVDAAQVLPFSTGVIGEPLPVDRITRALPSAHANLSADGWSSAARAIMTTDTVEKGISRQFDLDGQPVTVTGIAKGAGMIRPDMATMLAYVATDASVAGDVLDVCLRQAVDASFNRITIDGDTSTNDACVLVATGSSAAPVVDATTGPAWEALVDAVTGVCTWLAQAIVRDAEGATRFVTVTVEEAATVPEALQVAYTVAHSPLVKTAFFGADPNWGRILAAVGRAGIRDFDLDAVRIFLDDVCIVTDGGRDPGYAEAAGQAVMEREEIGVRIVLGRGPVTERVWTSDLSYDYVRINAEYRS